MEENKLNQFNSQGEKNGYWKEFYINGQLRVKGNYVDGKKEGYWEEYDSKGNIKSVGFYKHNKKEGQWRYYYYNYGTKIKTVDY